MYEADLAHVRVGQPAKVTLDYLPGRVYDAKVSYVYPYLETGARTGRVRVELANKELELRPGMYASVELASDARLARAGAGVGRRLHRTAAPRVRRSRAKAASDRKRCASAPRPTACTRCSTGLEAGDLVATSGVFLIAAEARISTAAKYWDNDAASADAAAAPDMALDPRGSRPSACRRDRRPSRRSAPAPTRARDERRTDADQSPAAPAARLHLPDAPGGEAAPRPANARFAAWTWSRRRAEPSREQPPARATSPASTASSRA